jgi:hypothetical protein
MIFFRGDGDGGKNSPADSSGRETGKLHSSPQIIRIRLYIVNYILLLLLLFDSFSKKNIITEELINIY